LVPASISLGAKKHGSLIVVNAVNLPAFGGKVNADFGTDQARRSSDKESFHINARESSSKITSVAQSRNSPVGELNFQLSIHYHQCLLSAEKSAHLFVAFFPRFGEASS
jgi:hypothetical protein